MILTRAIQSMDGQPPFLPNDIRGAISHPTSLLDCELAQPLRPDLEPIAPIPEPTNLDCVYELPALEKRDDLCGTEPETRSSMMQYGVLIDVETLPTPPHFARSTTTSPRSDFLIPERITQRDVSFPYQPYLQAPQHPSKSHSGSYLPYRPLGKNLCTGSKSTSRTFQFEKRKLDAMIFHSGSPPHRFDATNAVAQHNPTIPLTTSRSTSHANLLIAGLRPLPPPTIPARGVWDTAVSNARQEVDLNNGDTSFGRNDCKSSRNLTRRRGVRDLRAFIDDNIAGSDSNIICAVGEIKTPPARNVADMRNRYEKPLPPLPINESVVPTRSAMASTRRLRPTGVYGASALLHKKSGNARTSSDFHTNDNHGLCSSAPLPPSSPLTSIMPEMSLAPELPTIPHISHKSILREMKHEHSSLMNDDLSSPSATTSSLSSTSFHSENKGHVSPDPEARVPLAKEQYNLPYIPYSPSIVRKGTLRELGGRVVRIRKQFEDKAISSHTSGKFSNSNTQTCSGLAGIPSSSTTQHESSHRQRSNAKHINPVRASSKLPPRSLVFHTTTPVFSSKHSTERLPQYESSSTSHASSHRSTETSRPSSRSSIATDINPDAFPLYTTLHSDQAIQIRENPIAFRATMSENISRRLQEASDEFETSTTRQRAADQGHTTDVSSDTLANVGETEYEWQWKRFADREWQDKERQRRAGRR